MAGQLNYNRNQLGVVGRTWSFSLMSKVVLLSKFFKQSVEIIDDNPKTDVFIVLLEIFFDSFIELLVCGLRAFEWTPVVT